MAGGGALPPLAMIGELDFVVNTTIACVLYSQQSEVRTITGNSAKHGLADI
jgi:hypothetical protein